MFLVICTKKKQPQGVEKRKELKKKKPQKELNDFFFIRLSASLQELIKRKKPKGIFPNPHLGDKY